MKTTIIKTKHRMQKLMKTDVISQASFAEVLLCCVKTGINVMFREPEKMVIKNVGNEMAAIYVSISKPVPNFAATTIFVASPKAIPNPLNIVTIRVLPNSLPDIL
jgi:hypothetical protein